MDTRIRICGYGYADTDKRIRIRGYVDTDTRIRGYGYADTDTWIRICGCGYADTDNAYNPLPLRRLVGTRAVSQRSIRTRARFFIVRSNSDDLPFPPLLGRAIQPREQRQGTGMPPSFRTVNYLRAIEQRDIELRTTPQLREHVFCCWE